MKKYYLFALLILFLVSGCETKKYIVKNASAEDVYNKIVSYSSSEAATMRGKFKNLSYSTNIASREVSISYDSYVRIPGLQPADIASKDQDRTAIYQEKIMFQEPAIIQPGVTETKTNVRIVVCQSGKDVQLICDGTGIKSEYPLDDLKKSLSAEYTIIDQ